MYHILHPELVERIPNNGLTIANAMQVRATAIAERHHGARNPGISVVIRALCADNLNNLLLDLCKQDYDEDEVEKIVIVDESSSRTAQVARSWGAVVVSLAGQDKMTSNEQLATDAASYEIMYMTRDALLSTDQTLSAVANVFAEYDDAGAAFTGILPRPGNPRNYNGFDVCRSVIAEGDIGVLASQTCAIIKPALDKLGGLHDPGADSIDSSVYAAKLLANGIVAINEPLLAVHDLPVRTLSSV